MIQRFITKWKKGTLPHKENSPSQPQRKDHKRKDYRQKLAQAGEIFARAYLKNLGWTITEQNWRAGRLSEVDIIARDRTGVVVFVEVKARSHNGKEFGFMNAGFESIDARKRRKIITGAFHYLAKHDLTPHAYRFDAVILYYREPFEIDRLPKPEVNHVTGIF